MNKKCQVFTPDNIVIKLLDSIDYRSNLFGKKVIENACGDGCILKEIVKRYIKDCIKNRLSLEEIKYGIENDIYAAEIDEEHFKNCIANLDSIALEFGLNGIKWTILNADVLKENFENMFDYCIGNPPYIKYKEIPETDRNFVKSKFSVCKKGKFDYCYAFIETSLKCLNKSGKMAYLIPSSIFKNVFAEELRNFLLPDLQEILDFKTEKLFDKALISSSIIVCNKSYNKAYITYNNQEEKFLLRIPKIHLKNKWVFKRTPFEVEKNKNKVKFGDYYTASMPIATLLNKAFVLKNYREDEDYIYVENYRLEKDVTKPAASPRAFSYSNEERIIFPYFYKNHKLEKYEETTFEKKFQNAVKYLKTFNKELKERNSDTSAKWFEYGRSQALAHLHQKKILLSTVITNKVKIQELEKDCIPYAGIYITTNNGHSLKKAKQILESEAFLDYVKNIGIQASGTSLRITPADINQYEFSMEDLNANSF